MSIYLNMPFSVKVTTGIFSKIFDVCIAWDMINRISSKTDIFMIEHIFIYLINILISYLNFTFQNKKPTMSESQAFINSLKAHLQNFQSAITDVLLKRKPLTEKLRLFSVETLSFKNQMLKALSGLLQNFTKAQQQIQAIAKQSITLFNIQIKSSQQRIFKMNLHNLLRKKLSKLKEESITESMAQSMSPSSRNGSVLFGGQGKINQLQNSVLILEKQLGFQQDQDDFGVSNIIHKSMASLEHSQLIFTKNNDTCSVLSQSSFVEDIKTLKNYTENNSKQSNQNPSFLSRHTQVQMKIQSFTTKEYSQDTKLRNKKSLQEKKTVSKETSTKPNRRVVNSTKPPIAPNGKRITQGNKLAKGNNMLGNLLQQSYNNYLDN